MKHVIRTDVENRGNNEQNGYRFSLRRKVGEVVRKCQQLNTRIDTCIKSRKI